MLNKDKTKGFLAGVISATLIAGTVAVFASPVETAINVVYDNYRIIIDGADKSNAPDDSKPFVYNGRTFVPLRYIAESMGKKVLWDGDTSTIYINDEGNSREDVYFATQGYESADKGIYLDGEEKTVYLGYNSDYGTKFEENNKNHYQNMIAFNLNRLAKSVSGTVDMKDAKNDSLEGKIVFYDQNDNVLYQTPMLRKSTTPIPFEFQTSGVLQLKVAFVATNLYETYNLKIRDFRYSK
uniref:Copper amine oxidase-like N-terminal domain-containing protein n=1 Tax=uncultured Bacillota bacterium TaxID=344338 RepID=A0A650EN43_9FIRM|nr:hypothetical protein Firmicute1046_1590 [uncultured Firmicutes bacterium]